MNIEWLLLIIIPFISFIFILWRYVGTRKKLYSVLDELKFFKKEKDYQAEAMLLLNSEYKIMYANQSAKNLFSLNETKYKNKKVKLQIGNGTRGDFFEILSKSFSNNEESSKFNNASLIVAGYEKKVNIFIDQSALQINGTMTCIIDQVVSNQDMINDNQSGAQDFLTGLPSQFSALSDMNTLVVESEKKSEFFSIFLIGVDHFDDIQVALGLIYTNTILKRLGDYFRDNLKDNMSVYRMESDKFILIVNDLQEEIQAKQLARNVIIEIENIFRDNNIHLTISIGITFYPIGGENATKLTDNVYIALNKAQRMSESNIEIFSNEDKIIHLDEVQMNDEIRSGLIKNEFILHYQPIFNMKGDLIVGAEALLRWKHPRLGLVSAEKFLHIAEKTGLIIDLGEYVFKAAILQRERCNAWVRDDFKITINMSLKEMQVEKLIPKLEILFNRFNVDAQMINLDISENAAMENIDKTANDFKLFKDLGLSLSLEHFGAGYSSLKYLNLLPIDTIKIDRSLIFNLTLNLKYQTTVKAIIEFAHILGYKIIAEGIETAQESNILEGLQCDYAQGYLYARPLPSNELETLLK